MFHIKNLKKITSSSLLAFMALTYWTAKAENAVANNSLTDVTAELMLSIDVSGSVNSDEYNLQMDGYAEAFRNGEVISTIKSLPEGLAVGVQFWASLPAPPEPWRVLKTEQDSKDFANYLDNLARPSSNTSSLYKWYNNSTYSKVGNMTNLTGAIAAATEAITTNKYNGDVLVVDISGDGKASGYQFNANNSYDGYCDGGDTCQGVKNARDSAVAFNITLNGLPIENSSDSQAVTNFFDAHVKGGTKGFVETAAGFSDFTRAAKDKIFQEVSAALTPNAQPDSITADEDAVATYNVIAGDANNNNAGQDTDPNGNALTVTKLVVGTTEYSLGTTVTMPSGALLTLARNGNVTYDPNGLFESYSANDSLPTKDQFTYTISDSSGYKSSAIATLDINGVADNPDAVDDAVTTDENTNTDIDVLDNDTDVDSEANELSVTQINGIGISSGSVINLTSGSSVTLNANGTLNYDPTNNNTLQLLNNGDSRKETIEYTVSDELGNTDTANVEVTVTGITDSFAD